MLDASLLADKLREFQASGAPGFRGFPTTNEQARHEWAQAFSTYFEQIQEDVSPPVPSHPTLVTTGVESGFFASLGLESSISAASAADDFASAWANAVLAVTPGSTGPEGPNTYTFLSFTNVSTLRAGLLSDLLALFTAPSASATDRLAEIADAFHTATSGLEASATLTTASGSSPSTLGFK